MEFRLLGDLQAWHNGHRVPLGGHRQRCVLAVLLLDPGHVMPVSRIVAHAWPDDPPETAPDLVTSYISRLRRGFARAAGQIELVSHRPGYLVRIDPDLVDVHRFSRLLAGARRDAEGLDPDGAREKLNQALDLWRGTPLADLDSPWLDDQRTRLEQDRLDAVELLAGIELEAGRPDRVAALVRELADAHPEREQLTVLAVRILDAMGEPSRAVDLAGRAIRALRDQGLDPTPELRQAQLDALRPKKLQQRARAAGGRAQLPPDTPAFTGRHRELEALIALVDKGRAAGSVVICAVDGMAGIGKTAFAIHAGHQLAAHFPDGQLFIDLHGFTPGTEAVSPQAALDRILRTLGVAPQGIPLDLEECAALYRDRLVGTRTLIVLDNAVSEAQVRPLLPAAPGCLVLVTGRRRLAGLDDARGISLGVLSDADATALFTAIAGPERVPAGDEALRQAIALCGNIPLAIRIAAARLKNRPAWPARYLADRLRDAQRLTEFADGERSLGAALTVSYDHLTPEEQRMFRHLGMHPGADIDVFAAAALAAVPRESADLLLEALVDHNLLMQPTTGRYQLHDLVLIYARSIPGPETAGDRDAALARLMDYYLYTARTADQLLAHRTVNYAPPVENVPGAAPALTTDTQAAAWMETERVNLTAVVDHAADHGSPVHAIALPTVMHSSLSTHGHWMPSQRLQRIALAVAQRTGDRHGEAGALCCLGEIQTVVGQAALAVDSFTRALEAYQQSGDRLGQANARASRAQVHHQTAHFAQALRDLREALDLYRDLGDGLGQAGALATLGAVQRLTGQYSDAQETLERALDLYAHFGHRLGQAVALSALGELQQLTGQYADAALSLDHALDLYQKLGHRLGQAEALTHLGQVQQLTGHHAVAEQTLGQALELNRSLGYRPGQAEALIALGRVQHAMQRHGEAIETLQQAIQLCRQLGHRLGQADALTVLAGVQRATGRYQDAADSHRRALDLYRQIEEDL
jgi:tetratricopeptide (TPR) repeat protein/DNA-binding SARP family transcriptional activator